MRAKIKSEISFESVEIGHLDYLCGLTSVTIRAKVHPFSKVTNKASEIYIQIPLSLEFYKLLVSYLEKEVGLFLTKEEKKD